MFRYGRERMMVLCAVAICAALAFPVLRAQAPPQRDAAFLIEAYADYRSMRSRSPYRDLRWQYLGPANISGRATDVAVADKERRRRIYVAYATSGVWRTDDDGASWQPIFDDYPVSSIGDIAVAPSNPDIVWIGTGEANLFRASMPGVGIYKSQDGGRTFAHAGLTDTHTIARIVVHPTNPQIVYVAATGHGWTDNAMRGVFKTTDGGATWQKVFYRSERTGAVDLVMDPTEPDTLYAAMWQRIRRKWSDPRVEPGYGEGGIWKTTDGGATWSEANAGLPDATVRGRIGIDIARSDPSVLYAFVDNYEPGRPPQENERDAYGRTIMEARIKSAEIYRTSDKGATWTKVSESDDAMMRHSGTYGWVFGQIRVDPTDENTIYTLGLRLNVSRDGGKSFSVLRGMHGDHHGLWVDPGNASVLYNANDGGFYHSADAGKTWKFAVSAGGAQFYNVTLDTSKPAWAYGSIQDHGSYRTKVDLSAGRDRIAASTWERAPGGEGSFHAVDPSNPNIVYSHGFYGNFTRTDLSIPPPKRKSEGESERDEQTAGAEEKPAGPQRETRIRPQEENLRAQWMAPIIVSPHDNSTIYAAYQFVFKSTSRGDAWQKISPDLTSNDSARMLLKSSNAIPYQTITALAESVRVRGLLYAGTDDGRLHVTRDGGTSWTDLTAALPTRKWISRVVPSGHAEGTVYVTQRGREDDEFGVYVYKSTDFGRTFTSIAGNVPAGSVNVIREDPAKAETLYLGTDFGAFVTTDGGRQWHALGSNLPSVQVSDLAYHARDNLIVVATYGRGMYVMDALKVRAVR